MQCFFRLLEKEDLGVVVAIYGVTAKAPASVVLRA